MADSTSSHTPVPLQPVDDLPTPVELARELCHLPGFVFFDTSSAGTDHESRPDERFSLITAKPIRLIQGNLFEKEDFTRLREAYDGRKCSPEETPDLGFPTSGLYGSIGYEGDFLFGEYHECLVYDHVRQTWFEEGSLSKLREHPEESSSSLPSPFAREMTPENFCAKVRKAQDYIAAGDIYQVNLSHRLIAHVEPDFDPFALHQRLRLQSPAPYAAYLDLCNQQIISSSPEQFLSMSGRTIRTRPIKGPRPRFRDRREDEKSAYDL
ncbi:MAG: chorismate-binding protein, partial [Verrucomicrobiota bacterium]